MATLAAVAGHPDTVFGDRRVAYRDVTFSSSYTTNGEAITRRRWGCRRSRRSTPTRA
jgi:hypothetical protein